MEPIFRQTQKIEDIHLDCFGRLKPSALLYFAQEAAGGHCQLLKLDWDTLAKQDLFWAVIRQKVHITRLPTRGETITVETWPMPTTRSAFPIATVAYDEKGNELFQVIGLWVLMNTKTRSMVLPGKSGVDLTGTLRGTELTAPGSIVPKPLENIAERTVRFTELDRNGHMNNTYYMNWLDDLLPKMFHETHPIREFTLCYHSEALENQNIALHWQLLDGPILQVDALRESTDVHAGKERVFSAQAHY